MAAGERNGAMAPSLLASAVLVLLPIQAIAWQTAPDPPAIWAEFRDALRNGQITLDRIHPHRAELADPLLGFLNQMRAAADWREFSGPAESFVVGNTLHFLIPLTFYGKKDTYCFSLVVDNGEWYFQHMESISIRLDRTAPPPTSTFPDIAEEKKAWIREEGRASEQVRLFQMLAKEKGRQFAFRWLQDGVGYELQARTWSPFVTPARAFILYACWEESRMKMSAVTLERLDDREAVMRLEPIYLKLYDQTAHLKQQITREDYLELFRTIWLDRARQAGWDLRMDLQGHTATLHFRSRDQ